MGEGGSVSDNDDLRMRIEAGGKSVETTLGGLREATGRMKAGARLSAPAFDPSLANDDPYPVPGDMHFIHQETLKQHDFIEAPDLAELAEELCDLYEEVGLHVPHWRIHYLWRREGSVSRGKAKMGYCKKPSGELRFYSNADFVVVLAADYVRAMQPNLKQVKALLFHELSHVGGPSESGKPTLLPHDAEVFYAELEHFGAWAPDLEPFTQLGFAL